MRLTALPACSLAQTPRQVPHTYARFFNTYGIMNEHQVGMAESTCSAVFGASAVGHGGKVSGCGPTSCVDAVLFWFRRRSLIFLFFFFGAVCHLLHTQESSHFHFPSLDAAHSRALPWTLAHDGRVSPRGATS